MSLGIRISRATKSESLATVMPVARLHRQMHRLVDIYGHSLNALTGLLQEILYGVSIVRGSRRETPGV